MSLNIDTVNTYLDGFRTNDHAQPVARAGSPSAAPG